ncbi:MAG: hypothetical protein ACI841_002601 [Planctomycetota bacterium]|jgi:hypothetical protein
MRSLLLALAATAGVLVPAMQSAEQTAPAKGVQIGALVPKIRLNDQDGKAVTVGGKSEVWTVLAFYPKAATGG